MPWRRRAFRRGPLARALNIEDLRQLARRRVPHFSFEYVEGGAEGQPTLRCHREARTRWKLGPATLLHTRARHQRRLILGREANAPLIIAPTGFNGMLYAD